MQKELQISFFNCCKVEEAVITVKTTGHPRFSYIESAARSLTRWITVKAGVVVRRFVRFAVPFLPVPRLCCKQKFAFNGGLRL